VDRGLGLHSACLFSADVVRSVLLFCLTPVWSPLLGLAFLGERVTTTRLIAIGLGLAGLLVVLGGGATLPVPQNFGDWLALTSGMAWALGTLGLYKSRGISVSGQLFSFLLGGLVVALLAASLMPDLAPNNIAASEAAQLAVFVVLAAVYVLPMTWLTVWPATLLSPARVGLLLMSEVVVGLVSAALLANEPFGWREVMGAVLIVGAAVVELTGAPADSPAAP